MFTKQEFRAERNRLRNDICLQLFNLRKNKNLTLTDLSIKSKMPLHIIESLELHGLLNTHLNDLQQLANFYGKYIKIELVDEEQL